VIKNILNIIGSDSTEAAGKMARYLPAAQAEQKYRFSPVTILTILSYTKMVKISAIRSVFATKNSLKNAFVAVTMPRTLLTVLG